MSRLIFAFSKQSEFVKIRMINQHTQRLQAFENYLQLLLKKALILQIKRMRQNAF